MRIWQPRSVAWMISWAGAFSMRTVSARSGVAACGMTAAPSTAKASSGIGRLAAEVHEQSFYPLPDLCAAAEAAPVRPHDADEAIADVDRDDVLVARGCARLAHRMRVMNEKRLDVGSHSLDGDAPGAHTAPHAAVGLELDHAAGAGKERERPRIRARHHEE